MPNIEKVLSGHDLNVSHETIEKLEIYEALLKKWQKAINLVSASTLPDAAMRHFLDSVQLIKYIPDMDARLVDIGSGAGFPGLVLAILGVADVHLIESDQRKCEFLRTVSRETKTPVTVHSKRAEDCLLQDVGFVTARALAPLSDLLGFVSNFGREENCECLFLKGQQYQSEIDLAREKYDFDCDVHNSLTDKSGSVLQIKYIYLKKK